MSIFDSDGDFNKYRFFYAVAICKSFSKATEYLHVSQPAISHAIKELEEQLHTKLFIRNNKNVTLTEEGDKLMHYVIRAFDNINMGEQIIKEKKDDLSGIIRIGIYSHISLFMLPKIMDEFSKKYPNSKFYVHTTSNNEMSLMLKNNELDFVIMQYPIFVRDDSFKEEIICELENCFYCNKKYYDAYIKDNNSIVDFPFLLPTRGFSDINGLEETLKSRNITSTNKYTIYSSELTTKLALQGMGIGWGLKKCVEKYIENKELYELPVLFDMPRTKFSIAYDSNFLNKTTREFIDFFKEKIKDINL